MHSEGTKKQFRAFEQKAYLANKLMDEEQQGEKAKSEVLADLGPYTCSPYTCSTRPLSGSCPKGSCSVNFKCTNTLNDSNNFGLLQL